MNRSVSIVVTQIGSTRHEEAKYRWLACIRSAVGLAIWLLLFYRKGVEVVTSAEVDSPPVLDSEVSETIISLRERFEAVRRGEIHRVRGRLGNLSPDLLDFMLIWHYY